MRWIIHVPSPGGNVVAGAVIFDGESLRYEIDDKVVRLLVSRAVDPLLSKIPLASVEPAIDAFIVDNLHNVTDGRAAGERDDENRVEGKKPPLAWDVFGQNGRSVERVGQVRWRGAGQLDFVDDRSGAFPTNHMGRYWQVIISDTLERAFSEIFQQGETRASAFPIGALLDNFFVNMRATTKGELWASLARG
jgi:hypothetical protein